MPEEILILLYAVRACTSMGAQSVPTTLRPILPVSTCASTVQSPASTTRLNSQIGPKNFALKSGFKRSLSRLAETLFRNMTAHRSRVL